MAGGQIFGLDIKPSRANWLGTDEQARPLQYILAIVNLDGGKDTTTDDFYPAPTEYVFAMNPQVITPEIPFSTSLIPTQGGIYKDSKGIFLSNLTISGTTGLRPNKASFSQFTTNSTSFVLDNTTLLPQGESTGFDEYVKLRNLLSMYAQLQKDTDISRKYCMVFQNGKDEEVLVVEPMTMSFPRDKGSPHTVMYSLAFKVLGRKKFTPLNSVKNKFDPNTIGNLIGRYRSQLTYYYSKIQSLLTRNYVPGTAFIRDSLVPVNNIINLLNSAAIGSNRMLNPPGGIYLLTTMSNLRDAADSLDLFTSNFSTVLDNTTVTSSSITLPDSYLTKGYVTTRQSLSNSVKNIINTLAGVNKYLDGKRTILNENVTSAKQNYSVRTRDGQDNTSPHDGIKTVSNATSFKREIVQGIESITDFAKRTTGDTTLWKYLVGINKLKAPYISVNGDGVSVARPGDYLLVPNGSGSSSTSVSIDTVQGTSELDKKLGRDLRLRISNTSNNSYTSFDLVTSQKGDLDLVQGIDNMKQAVTIKFNTEQTELALHPFFGGLYPIGTKGQLSSILKFKENTRNMLLVDSRISSIVSFTIKQTGDTLNVNTVLSITGSTETLETSFNLG